MKTVVLLFGPTAVGKTSFSFLLYKQFLPRIIEIISADSRQIYKGLDICTALPKKEIRDQVRHYLISELDITSPYTVFDFVQSTNTLIKKIHVKNNIAVVSGGTAYYLYHLYRGLPNTPPSDARVRQQLQKEYNEKGIEILYKRLYTIDPVYAGAIQKNNTQRIIRALEIYILSGTPVSSFEKFTCSNTSEQGDYSFFIVGLKKRKEILHKSIVERVEQMFSQGLVDEVKNLYKKGLRLTHNAAHTIGVQEFFQNDMLCKAWITNSMVKDEVLQEIKDKIIIHTRQYAKRQYTFFRRFGDSVRWIDTSIADEAMLNDYAKEIVREIRMTTY